MIRRLLICLVVAAVFAPLTSRGDDFHDAQLDKGIRNSDYYAYLLLTQARQRRAEAPEMLKQAVTDAPDLPAVHFALARQGFSWSGPGILACIDHLVDGFNAYARNFWWSFTLWGALFFSLVLSFVVSFLVVVSVRLPRDIPLMTHDIKESPRRAIGLVLLVILSVISPLFLIAGILILIGIYMSRTDRSVVYTFLVFLIVLPLLLSFASFYISAPSSGTVKAVVQENESRGNAYALEALNGESGETASFSYALSLKREGHFQEAIDIYSRLSAKNQDPRILVNLGNCYAGLYNFEEDKKGYLLDAVKFYSSAISSRPSAQAYYNLSQVSRELLEFAKGEEYFKNALTIDRAAVTGFRAIASRQANRFVIDETVPEGELWSYAKSKSKDTFTFGLTLLPPAAIAVIAFVLLLIFALLPGRLRHTAYRCRKCGNVLCNRCERELVVGQICSQCYGSLLRLAELDVKERVARILSIYEQQKRRRDIIKVLSFILPGASHVYAGKVLLGFLLLWPFLFCLAFPFVSAFFFPGSILISHGVVGVGLVFLALIIYGVSNIITRQGLAKGWL
ncbi:MAG: hypothetical protein M0024_04130 [Nitrospiraceae bacterium]|nr:hypothetical protein [Nitrospiraceae bacterium]